MKNIKKIVFITGTRADFGKLKSLLSITQSSDDYDVHIFATGMHLNSLYGYTIDEIRRHGFHNIYPFINHDTIENMDRTLAKTIDGFSHFVAQIKPDLIVVHGDRVEAMAGALVGSLNNILVAHIEGGEVSGTIDELVRHAVSKMSHVHLVSNKDAKSRLVQLGELPSSIFILGSPDLDLMNPGMLPELNIVKEYYDIEFSDYSVAMYHSVTTEFKQIQKNVKYFVDALLNSDENYIVIYPNNDLGSYEILNEYKRLEGNERIRIFPSLRFEYFLTFLKNANYIVGNSSAGVREAHYYNTPTVDIGSRQSNRASGVSIFHSQDDYDSIMESIEFAKNYKSIPTRKKNHFGQGNSDKIFLDLLNENKIWLIECQKQFQDIDYE
jgi:UDP-N-acetylglucosamine 2-epimerase (hydrolysing)